MAKTLQSLGKLQDFRGYIPGAGAKARLLFGQGQILYYTTLKAVLRRTFIALNASIKQEDLKSVT